MKRSAIAIVIASALATSGFAQQEEIKSAGANIEKKNYIGALDDLNKAKKKVNALMTDQLASVLPAKFGEFEMEKESSMNGPAGMEGQGVSLNKSYSKPKPVEATETGTVATDPASRAAYDPMAMMNREQIKVQVTTNMMMASSVMNAHSMSESGMSSEGAKHVRVKGYRAVLRSGGNEGGMATGRGESNTETAEAIVGAAYIKVEAQGMKEKGQAEKFLNAIDFDKLKLLVGE